MKKRLYKAKKRWVVAGVALAAGLSFPGMVSADEVTTVSEVSADTQSVSGVANALTEANSVTVPEVVAEVLEKDTVSTGSTTAVPTETAQETLSESELTSHTISPAVTVPSSSEVVDVEKAPIRETVTAKVTETTIDVAYHGDVPKDSDIRVAIWSDAYSQDDLKWYVADKTATVTAPLQDHMNYGLYHIHTYSRHHVTGKMTFLDGKTVTVETPRLETAIKAVSEDAFDIEVKNVPTYFHKLIIPVWSAESGQDDLKWYEGQKVNATTYRLRVDTANHRFDSGTYHIHYYEGKPSGKKVYVGNTTYQKTAPKATITVSQVTDGSFEVTLDKMSNRFTSVYVPTWTGHSGQDDLKWYRATRQANGSYKALVNIKDHRFETGNYHIHTYGETADKRKTFLGSIQHQVPAMTVTTEVTKVSDESFKVTVKQVPSYLESVMLPTWSDKSGQDDIKWYQAKKQKDGTYSATIAIKDHKYDSGLYHIHAYGNAGVVKNIFLNANQTYEITAPKTETTVQTLSESSFKVTVKNVPSYISSVTIPTWSAKDGQDDIKWYQAQKQKDGSYSLTVSLKDHRYQSGTYHIHTYGRSSEGTLIFLDNVQHKVKELPKPTANLEITNVDNQRGTFDVVISSLKSATGVTLIQLPTWSEKNGQDDIKWYQPKQQSDGTYKLTVRASNHKYTNGQYHVHLYLTDETGNRQFLAKATTEFKDVPIIQEVVVEHVGTGVHYVNVKHIYKNEKVIFAVWSEKNGQNDLRWYSTKNEADMAHGVFNVVNHSDTGTYHVHAYQEIDGEKVFLAKTTIAVSRTDYNNMPYYAQWDSRWGNKYYGQWNMAGTGCVPTALSMVYSALTGKDVKPTHVADWLYYKSDEFNKGGWGTSGVGILKASAAWGLKTEILNTEAKLTAALKEGHYVVAAVEHNKFTSGAHQLVAKGYKNGMTYMTDPYSPHLSGWYPISNLFREQSRDVVDTKGVGVPFIKITNA